MKKETQKAEERSYTANEVGVMIERFDDSLKTVAENVVSIDNRLGRLETKVDRLQDDMVEVKFELRQKVSIDQFQRLEKRVTKLERISLAG